jgi:hypothetical protein
MFRSPYLRFGIAIAALIAALMTSAEARTFKASAVNASATVTDGLAQVNFKVEVTNDELEGTMTNIYVVFEDGTEISLGDLAPSATVTSDEQHRTIDVSQATSRTIVMHVTLKYSLGGDAVETPWMLSAVAE